jgi:hypothetical protein
MHTNSRTHSPRSCSLGSPGQSMIIARLDETAGPNVCALSSAFSLFGAQVYYSLQLSHDGTQIEAVKMGCEEDCGR